MKKMHDVVIVGGGPGGAASALHLLKAGLKPVILEKEIFPRYHIGESLTGECGASLRRLGLEPEMQKQNHPVKHGVTVYGPGGKNSFWVPVAERLSETEMRPLTTWQVRRDVFDKMLLDTAIERGAEFLQGEVVSPTMDDDRVTGVQFRTPQGAIEDLKANVVIDASGQATFLANRGVTSPKERGAYSKQVATFSQVVGAQRDPGDAAGNTLIFYQKQHHWAWFIPLDDETVSVGVVTPSDYFKEQKLSKIDFLKQELQTLNPELARRVANTQFVEEARSVSNYSYHIENFTGKGFLCVGDAHRFIDPIFSFGLYFAMREAEFAAQAVTRHLAGENQDAANPFADYQSCVSKGQDIVQDLVDCFWHYPLQFTILVHHSHTLDIIDCFAGRLYGEESQNLPGVQSMRKLLAKQRGSLMNHPGTI